MDAAAELAGRAEAHHAHLVAVFLAEQGDGTQLLGLVERHFTMLVDVDVLTNQVVHHAFHLAQFLVGHFLEVREVETQRVGADERTLLLHMVAQHLFQGVVQQVRGRVVGCAGVALVGVHAGHELSLGLLGQFLHDVYGLVVLALGIDNLDGLVLADEHALFAYLSAHFAIERSDRKHQFVELVLLLGDFPIP